MSEAARFIGKTVGEVMAEVERETREQQAYRISQLAIEAAQELFDATAQHAPIHSPWEGYAVILEELDELWDVVKAYPKRATPAEMRSEALQVAAMALRFVLDVCDRAPVQKGGAS